MTQDHRFFRCFAWLLAALALAGFAQTFYLRPLFEPEGKFTLLMLAHGLAYTVWTAVLVLQTTLIGQGRTALHRRVGYGSIGIVVAMLSLSAALALVRTRQWLDDPRFDAGDVLAFLLTPAITIVFFAGMYTAALLFRATPIVHKRLLLIANLDIYTPALSRLPWLNELSPLWQAGLMDLGWLALLLHDWRTLKRVHPATLIGGLILLACQVGREALATTDTWMAIAVWLAA